MEPGKVIELLTLAVYVPIIMLSGRACYLFLRHMLPELLRRPGENRVGEGVIALGLGATFALASHFLEALQYGSGRWFGTYMSLSQTLGLVLVGKLLILAGCVFTISAVKSNGTPRPIVRTVSKAAMWFVLGILLATWWRYG